MRTVVDERAEFAAFARVASWTGAAEKSVRRRRVAKLAPVAAGARAAEGQRPDLDGEPEREHDRYNTAARPDGQEYYQKRCQFASQAVLNNEIPSMCPAAHK